MTVSPSPMFISFKKGVGTLIEALNDCLTGELVVGQAVESLTRTEEGQHQAYFSDGSHENFDAVVLTTSAPLAAKLLHPTETDLAKKLAAIRYISSATISPTAGESFNPWPEKPAAM